MSVFDNLGRNRDLRAIREPVQLFDTLPNKGPGLGYLRQAQGVVLDKWSARRDETDLVVKMNTGTGKTIVGLLILQSSLHDGVAPALYVAPDPHLADEVANEGRRLGLDIVNDPKDPKFRAGTAICVVSLQKMFNGRSAFGLAGASTPIKVGTIVVDDAHSAVARLDELSRVVVPVADPAHSDLMALFEDDLRRQSASKLLDIQADEYGAVMRIPFWSWQEKADDVLRILHPRRDEQFLEWTWPLIGDHLSLCEATVTSRGIEIAPPLPPIHKFASFVDAKRRVYLTATLANDSVLVTHFDADDTSIADPIFPDSAADLGDRLVLAPQELLPSLTDDEVRTAVAGLAVTHNVVVLVPSLARAERWHDVADDTVSSMAEITTVVGRLRQERPGALVVIVNRYDGINLPDDACRVLVLDGLPQVTSGSERREADALRDSTTTLTRQVQRFEQGLGRGVRSREDRCAVLVLDRRLVELMADPDTPARLSAGTRAQLELSRQVAAALGGGVTLERIIDTVHEVIDGSEQFKTAAREALIGVTYETAPLAATARPLRDAYAAAVRGDNLAAAAAADVAVNVARTTDKRLAGWLMEKAAAYRNPVDPVEAQKILASATALNSSTLRPVGGIAFTAQRPTRRQADAAVDYLTHKYPTGNDLCIGVEALLADLAWDPEHTDEAEQALCDLGEHLGFASRRPEKETGSGGDVLWCLGDNHYQPIEAKTGAETDFIAKKDVDQLGGTVRWVQERLRPSGEVIPLMMHPSAVAHATSTPPPGMRVIDTDHRAKLIAAVRAYATALAANDAYQQEDAVQQQLAHWGFNGRQFTTRYATPVHAQGR
ncbi:MAG: hypothetical protein BGO38_09960 [Cellulomonas sp. 73-145]|uniref:helicase C-terminal domain-containing protein n=1 Tax=Cellulomonas sp. 73-145 TaxID=1895739 RepID=UPI0009292C2F|nr:helicase C-terminal domain-containing protein [Cellulomonas sp. 73-145]OJV61020.1 MAG: hypothetical protein BGO38_09960 [Cellulomonas sp. 73-145]